tara:strand:+ start:363 stop:551 length:189 start_codon:yes stop_codon:yes gene_type:complete
MKTYIVKAEMITDCYLEVEAENKNEAYDIAKNTDGGDWVEAEDSYFTGGWILTMDNIWEKKE